MRDCIHGQQARACQLCEKDQTIAVLEKALVLALDANFENPDAVAYYIRQAEQELGVKALLIE